MTATEAAPTPPPPIFAASTTGDYDLVQAELAKDASVATLLTDGGRSALSLAAAKGHTKIVKTLLEANAVDSSVAGWTAAHHAAFGGHADVLAALFAKQMVPAATVGGVISPLLLAASKGHVSCLALLLDAAPASINTAVDAHGRTALMLAATSGSAEAIEFLKEKGANLNAISQDGKTALMWAVAAHKPLTLAALAKLGADPDIAAPLPDVIIPGQDRSKGETAFDMVSQKTAKDPTMRVMMKWFDAWNAARKEDPKALPPDMYPMPWITHAYVTKEKEEREAAEAAAKADEPAIEEVKTGEGEKDEDDIFGDEDVQPAVEAGMGKMKIEEVTPGEESVKKEAEEAQKAVANAQDLDELD